MAARGYEVYGRAENRWFLESAHDDLGEAVDAMKRVAASPGAGYESVAVFEERTFRPRKVEEERCVTQPGAAIRVEAIEDAPICRRLADYYDVPARVALGRLLRRYLDHEGITALELLHDAVRLRRLLNDDRLAPKALGRVAGIQAKAVGASHPERIDALYRAAGTIQTWAQKTQTRRGLVAALRDGGVGAVRDRLPRNVTETGEIVYVSGALAHYLRGFGEWDEKVTALAELAGRADDDTLAAADGALAEILDGPEAVRQIVDWHPHLDGLEDGLCPLIGLVGGGAGDGMPTRTAQRLREVATRHGLPRTRAIVLDRVDRGLRGVQPLRREGGGDDAALANLVRSLATPGGLLGGPEMAAAVTRRARLAFAEGDEDLPPDAGVARVVDVLPDPAVRLGYLLALAASPFGRDHWTAVQGQLWAVVRDLSRPDHLLPREPDRRAAVVRDLQAHVRDLQTAMSVGTALDRQLDALIQGRSAA